MPTRAAILVPAALLAALIAAGGCQSTPEPAADAAPTDGVFIHIKSGPKDKHAALMGLRMAQIMADDHDVLVYFDVDGVKLVKAGAADLKMEPFGSSGEMLEDLAAKGVTVYACPGCLKAAAIDPADLAEGVVVADKEGFFAFTDGRILTLDY